MYFPNNISFDVGLFSPNNGEFLDQLEKIDTILIGQNKTFNRWKKKGRQSMDPRCIKAKKLNMEINMKESKNC